MLRALQRRPDGSAPSKEEQQRALDLLARVLEPGPISGEAVFKAVNDFHFTWGAAEQSDREQRRRHDRAIRAARAERGEREESPAKPIALRIGSGIMRGKTRGLYLTRPGPQDRGRVAEQAASMPAQTTLRPRWIAQ